MLRLTIAVLLVLGQSREMPVVRLAGPPGTQPPAQQPPARPVPQPSAQLPPLPATQIATTSAAALDAPRHLTLTFVEPRPIEEVLRLVAAGTPFSLAIDSDVTGVFRGNLRDLTLRDALATLLTPLGLEFSLDGTVLRITRQRSETRQFDLNVLDMRRDLRRTTGTAAASPSAAGRATVSSVGPSEDVFTAIGEGIHALLSESGRVHIDRRAGLATVSDLPDRLERVALYLEALETRSAREVRLQAQALEVTLKPGASSIDWRAVRQSLGLPADAPTAGLVSDIPALRIALASQGEIHPLWSPEVTTINNEPALLRIETSGLVSLTLTVMPQISSGGIVQLAITHTWEDNAGEAGTKSPSVRRISEADTVARLTSGSAVLLSGLVRPVPIPRQAVGAAAIGVAEPGPDGYAELVVVVRPTIVTTGTRD